MVSKKRGMLKGRKAQITVFMIIGIILLFSSALIFYIKNQVVSGLPAEFVPAVEEVPLEAQPVKLYVENCLNRITEEALVHAGAHGGYIDPTDITYGKKFAPGPFPTESEALAVFEGGKAVVPYWWYLKSSNKCLENCEFATNRPTLTKADGGANSVEAQVEIYVKKNLGRCLQNFQSFAQQGFTITPKGEMDPEIKFTQDDTAALMTYPVEISKEGRTTEIKQYFTKVDVSMREVFRLATEIMNTQVERKILEYHTLNLISYYSKPVGNDRLPPMSHFEMDPSAPYLIWTKTETQQRMESYVFPPGVNMLQVIDTSNYRRNIIMDDEGVDRVATGYMDKTKMILNSTERFPFLEARFTYLDWWPIWLEINGGQEVLRPTKVGSAFSGFLFDMIGLEQYDFRYSYSFPVLVTIDDPHALNGDGFKFTFAMEGNVRDNEPMNSSYVGVLPIPAESYLCVEEHMNAGPVEINVIDMFTKEPIEGARVEMIVADESCHIGMTELDGTGRAVVKGKFPVGYGEIRIIKDDYVPVRTEFGAFLDEPGNYTYEMMPIFTVNATVTPIALHYQQGRYVVPEVPISSMSPKEQVILTMERIADDEFGEFATFLLYNATSGPQEIDLTPGTYEVNGYLMLDKPLLIPKESKTVNVPFKKNRLIEINETKLNKWMAGSLILNNVTGFWEVTQEDLLNNKKVKFKMLKWPLPSTHSKEFGIGPGLDQVTEHEETNSVYRTRLEPEWT